MSQRLAGPACTDPTPPQPPSHSPPPGSAQGLPLPSPCLHSHLPVREPRPPHSSHSGCLLLTAQDRGQPGSSGMSRGGRKQSWGASLPWAPMGAGSTGWSCPELSPEGRQSLNWGHRVVRGLLGEGWHHSHTAGAAKGLSMEWGWEVARLIQGHAGHPVKLELQRTVNTCFV